VATNVKTNAALREAIERARASADADGSLHPSLGERVATTPEFREAIHRLISDGTYDEAVAVLSATDPDLV